MTGNPGWFNSLRKHSGESIIFGNKSKGTVIAMGEVSISETIHIKEVSLVEGLRYNLLSVSQLCQNGKNHVIFNSNDCLVRCNETGKTVLRGIRVNEIYTVDPDFTPEEDLCLASIAENSVLWHKRFGHASMKLLHKLHLKELVVGLPKVESAFEQICSACATGKQARTSFSSKQTVSTSAPLDMIHMDLCGPVNVVSRGGNRYILVIVDDYSRYTWTIFLCTKAQTYAEFEAWLKLIENKLNRKLASIRTDNGTEFRNVQFLSLCRDKGIDHNFSAPRTPQQNGVVERKNRTLEDMSRTMLIASKVPKSFWAEAVFAACHILNRASLRVMLDKTPYELLRGRKPNISHLKVFGCKCFVHNNGKENLGKFDAKSDEGVFIGYSSHSKAYKIYNLRLEQVEESVHVKFDETAMGGHLIRDSSSTAMLDAGELQFFDESDPDWEPPQAPTTEAPHMDFHQADDALPVHQADHEEITDPPGGNEHDDHVAEADQEIPGEEEAAVEPTPANPEAEHRITRYGRAVHRPSRLEDYHCYISQEQEDLKSLHQFCGFASFVSFAKPKTVIEALKDQNGSLLCKRNCTNSRETKFGVWFLDLRTRT
ncbi:unnamed protein product [Rhodiola kirilowii]